MSISSRRRKRIARQQELGVPWLEDGLYELRFLAMQNLAMAEALAPLLVEGALE